MRIQKLDIKNFRGFEELTIEFPKEGPVVFIGGNGSGKSSVLDLLSHALKNEVFIFTRIATNNGINFTDFDVNLGKEFFYYISAIIHKAGEEPIQKNFSYRIGENGLSHYSEKDMALEQELKGATSDTSFPLCLYYPTHRQFLVSPQEIRRFILPQHKSYEDAFLKEANFTTFVNWFVEEENRENREKLAQRNFEISTPELNGIRNALKIFFQNFPSENYHNLRVETRQFNQVTNIPSSLVITKGDKDLNLTQLSDGEKMVITMVADITRRLTIANPSLENKLEGEGIVLIDELELHLHPSWQRDILPALTKTFPNIQFIVTTHSPQVISTVKRENVFILEDFKLVEFTPHTKGRDSNTILQDLFNVTERPEEAKKEFDELYRLMDDREIIRAKLHFEFLNEV